MTDLGYRSIEWMNAALTVKGLGASAKLLLVSIASFARGPDGQAFPSEATLAGMVGVSTRQISTLVSQLRAAGHLAVEPGRGRGGTNLYRITGCYPQTKKSASSAARPSESTATNCNVAVPEPAFQQAWKPGSPNQVLNNQRNRACGSVASVPSSQPYPRAAPVLSTCHAPATSADPRAAAASIPPEVLEKLKRLTGRTVSQAGDASSPTVGCQSQRGAAGD